jgi:peptidoglycan hydrolase CwlO-like protein
MKKELRVFVDEMERKLHIMQDTLNGLDFKIEELQQKRKEKMEIFREIEKEFKRLKKEK